MVQPIRLIGGRALVYGEGNLLSNQTSACCPATSQDGLISGRLRARAELKEPVCFTPFVSSAAIVVRMPWPPASSVWFEAVLHASHPVLRIARASAGGVRNDG